MRRSATLFAALAFLAQARADGGFYDYLFEPGALRLDEVIGMEVVTPEGKSVGRIKDVLFDRTTGKVESIALDRNGNTYPVSALVSAATPGQLIVEPSLDMSSAGGTALQAAPVRSLSSATREGGAAGELFIDLRAGTVRPSQ
jgi:hypothetical protein